MDRAQQEAAFEANILLKQIPSARDNWWQGDCVACDGYTTGSESAVEDWGYEHVLTCVADQPAMGRSHTPAGCRTVGSNAHGL